VTNTIVHLALFELFCYHFIRDSSNI